jgi:DNA invertase Pin-like site-specific DNA recombinase
MVSNNNHAAVDLSTASGKLMRTIMAGLAEFERDLIRERVKSGLAAARSRGVALGRQVGQRPSDKEAKKVLQLHGEGLREPLSSMAVVLRHLSSSAFFLELPRLSRSRGAGTGQTTLSSLHADASRLRARKMLASAKRANSCAPFFSMPR